MQCQIVCRVSRYDISVLTVNVHCFFYWIKSAFFSWHKPQTRVCFFYGIIYRKILWTNNDRLGILFQNPKKKKLRFLNSCYECVHNSSKTANVRINVTLRCVRVTIIAVERQ